MPFCIYCLQVKNLSDKSLRTLSKTKQICAWKIDLALLSSQFFCTKCYLMLLLTWKVVHATHSMMSWNLTLKKSSTETEYGVWKLLSCSFTYQSQKIRFRSPSEKNHKTSFSKVKSLMDEIFTSWAIAPKL